MISVALIAHIYLVEGIGDFVKVDALVKIQGERLKRPA
jgi:hypothetical protein